MLLNELLPSSALGLGWLVESLKNPTMDSCERKGPLPADAVMQVAGQSFDALAATASKNSFRLSLTRLLNNSNESKNENNMKLESIKVNRYQLRQPRSIFKELVSDEKARAWLNESIEQGRKTYLIVELQTAVNAVISKGESKEHSTDVDLTVPVSTIATGGADVLGLGSQLDSSVGGGYSRSHDLKKSFSMEGESIFAIGFKRIVWKSLGFKKDVDRAMLDEKITWSVFGEKRGNNDEEVITADLSDDVMAKNDAEEADDDLEEDEEDEEDEDEMELSELLMNTVVVDGQDYIMADDLAQ